MSEFFKELPSLVFRKIYKQLNTESKYNMTEMLKEDHLSYVITRSGVHDVKETIFCFLCQTEIFFDEFCTSDLNRRSLGFYLQFKHTSDFESNEIPLSAYNIRQNTPEDMQEADNVLKTFEHQLEQVYHTTNIDELEKHIETHEGNHYMPARYWNMKRDARVQAMENVMELQVPVIIHNGREISAADAFFVLTRENNFQKRAARSIVLNMLQQLRISQSIGGTWKRIFLTYENEPEIWPAHKGVQNFRLFLDVMDKAHDLVQPSDTRTLSINFVLLAYI